MEKIRGKWMVNYIKYLSLTLIISLIPMHGMESNQPRKSIKKRLFEEITTRPSLIEAIKKESDATTLERMIQQEFADVNEKDTQGLTPLYWAIEKQKADIVALLLKNGAHTIPLHAKDTTSLNPTKRVRITESSNISLTIMPLLHFAVSHGSVESVKKLIEHFQAKEKQHRQLVDNNQSEFDEMQTLTYIINDTDHLGFTPLHYAAERGNPELINILVSHGANSFKTNNHYLVCNSCSMLPDEWATVHNKPEAAQLLQKKMDDDCNTHLHYAVANSNIPRIHTLLKNHPEMITKRTNKKGNTPLHCAVEFGKKQAAETLLKIATDKNIVVNHPNHKYNRPLHKCVRFFDSQLATEFTDLLLKNGAEVNIKNIRKQTPLHLVSTPECAELLLKAGAQVNISDSVGATPLHSASFYNKQDIVDLLLNANASVNVHSKNGTTPLHFAAQNNNIEIMHKLLSHKANIDAQNVAGLTALHYAVINANKDIVQLLLANNANKNLKDNFRLLPIDLTKNEEIKALLK